ncbi:hypothetical protein EJ04DRAFT_525488 [Polyplosphaeria fusca]|uniref:Uncharacterized protein n=1 Tax=Polyplosphaeria fusca TaxID=682080 RepID=A0A9P4QWI3_9PLEO|nr:hypothetical protein EJ04DRAFT_525488 [Polyplosphaeria fusca]
MTSGGAPSFDVDLVQRLMNERTGNPEDWSQEKLYQLNVAQHLLPAQTVMHFKDCMYEGILPGGAKSAFPLLKDDEVPLENQPYSTWAPAPWNQLNYALWNKIHDAFFSAQAVGFVPIPARFAPLRARLCNGLVPMAGARWREKGLGDPKNFQQFYEFMGDIIFLFAFMNQPEVQTLLRQAYSDLAQRYAELEGALNARRESLGITERMNVTGMWAEYIEALFTTMSKRAHLWLVDRVDEIQVTSKAHYEATAARAGNDQAALVSAGKIFYERIQDLNLAISRADFVLCVPMEGFSGHKTSTFQDLPLATREDAYYKLMDARSWESYRPFLDAERRDEGLRDREALMRFYEEGRDGRAAIRKQLHGEPTKPGEEHWISILRSRIDWFLKHGGDPERQTWGFVCYRLTYSQSPDEWARFKEKLEADFLKSGEWVEGADHVKATGGLQWVDGQELGIAEGDVAAAKRHFSTFPQSQSFMRRMWKMDFLVVDSEAYLSYAEPPHEGSQPGDMGGHVRLVDNSSASSDAVQTASPGYPGHFKVKSTLVFDEIYPLLTSYALRPPNLWPLARLHPLTMYVGPTVKTQEDDWEMQRQLKASMLGAFYNHLRQRQRQS